MVFEAISYLILPNRDDDVAVEVHLKVGSFISYLFEVFIFFDKFGYF